MTTQTYPSGKLMGYVYDDKGELVSQSIDGIPFITNIKTNDNGLQFYTPVIKSPLLLIPNSKLGMIHLR